MSFIQPLIMAPNPRGAALLINRTFKEGEIDQYKRELVKNAIEANATEIRTTALRLEDLGDEGGVKAAFVDNGDGMSSNKITDYIGELFNGASSMGADGNFQMGARVSTLPFNQAGILVASWTEAEPEGTILWIRWDKTEQCYGVEPWEDEDGVAQPTGIPDPSLKHEIIEKTGHGTVFVLLGSKDEDHTVGEIGQGLDGHFVYPDVRNTRDDLLFYNSKFWVLPEEVVLKTMWAPRDLISWKNKIAPGQWFDDIVDHNSWRWRKYEGVEDRITKFAETKGSVSVTSHRGHKATVHWALFPEGKFIGQDGSGASRDTTDYYIPLGLFGEMFKGEIYNIRQFGKARTAMEHYGVARRELRDRLVLIIEPNKKSASFIGAEPSGARGHLMIANGPLPHEEWGENFALHMPQAIRERLDDLNSANTDDQKEKIRRIHDRLKNYFTRTIRSTLPTAEEAPTGDETDEDGNTGQNPDTGSTPGKSRRIIDGPEFPRGPRTGIKVTRRPRKLSRIGGGAKKRAPGLSSSHSNPTQQINEVWDTTGEEFTDGLEALVVKWVPAGRRLIVNGAHPYITELLRIEKVERKESKAEEVERYLREAIFTHLISHILSVELYARSTMAGSTGVGTDFTKAALSDQSLSATVLNLPTLESLVHAKFKGRTGLGKTKTPAA